MVPFFTTVRLGVVVLAAGEGARMRSALPKVLHPLCGRPLLGHILAAVDVLQPTISTVVLALDTLDTVRARFGENVSVRCSGGTARHRACDYSGALDHARSVRRGASIGR